MEFYGYIGTEKKGEVEANGFLQAYEKLGEMIEGEFQVYREDELNRIPKEEKKETKKSFKRRKFK